MSDALKPQLPRVHVVEDDDAYRRGLLKELGSNGHAAQGWASCEAFLADWHWQRCGVILLDMNFDTGTMDGEGLYQRLADLRCGMPVIVLTVGQGSIEREVNLAMRMGEKRLCMLYLRKPVSEAKLAQALADAWALEPAFRADRAAERAWMHKLLNELTYTQLQILQGELDGLDAYQIAYQLRLKDGGDVATAAARYEPVVAQMRAQAKHSLFGYNPDRQALGRELSPLIRSHRVANLIDLVIRELRCRQALLTADECQALRPWVQGKREPKPADIGPALTHALVMLQADSVKRVRGWQRWIEGFRPGEAVWPAC